MLEEKLAPLGVEITVTSPAEPAGSFKTSTEALIAMLTQADPPKVSSFPPVINSPAEADFLPMPAEEAAATMQLLEGFHATVFASEPEVQNPIAMARNDPQRLWIAANLDARELRTANASQSMAACGDTIRLAKSWKCYVMGRRTRGVMIGTKTENCFLSIRSSAICGMSVPGRTSRSLSAKVTTRLSMSGWR
jgi:hypothetical protein